MKYAQQILSNAPYVKQNVFSVQPDSTTQHTVSISVALTHPRHYTGSGERGEKVNYSMIRCEIGNLLSMSRHKIKGCCVTCIYNSLSAFKRANTQMSTKGDIQASKLSASSVKVFEGSTYTSVEHSRTWQPCKWCTYTFFSLSTICIFCRQIIISTALKGPFCLYKCSCPYICCQLVA